MQLLFENSNEFLAREGLGIIKGEVKGLDSNLKSSRIPHVGWNKVNCDKNKKIMSDDLYDKYFYFVHSFFVLPKNKREIIGNTIYDNFNFCSLVKKENILGCQFHPEKSGIFGLKFLNNILK